ncbi:MAG: helix-turn-helix domain-containing protein [Nitrospira sp.]|nr:helix-turn-helix domain-containing protein [Nitrospira sp.]
MSKRSKEINEESGSQNDSSRKSFLAPWQLPNNLMTIAELAELIGLSVQTIYNMVGQRRIPHVKVGRLLRFDKRLIDDWLKTNTVMPLSDLRR